MAADPQPYSVTLKPTGNSALDSALHDASSLITLQDKAPVGGFALVERARQDVGRFQTVLRSYGYYAAKIDLTIAGHPVSDPTLPDIVDRLPAEPKAEIAAMIRLRRAVPSRPGSHQRIGSGRCARTSSVLPRVLRPWPPMCWRRATACSVRCAMPAIRWPRWSCRRSRCGRPITCWTSASMRNRAARRPRADPHHRPADDARGLRPSPPADP